MRDQRAPPARPAARDAAQPCRNVGRPASSSGAISRGLSRDERASRARNGARCGAAVCGGAGQSTTCVTLNGSGIQLAVGPQPLRLRNHNSEIAHRIMVKRLATSPHDLIGITDSACKNQSVVVSVQYGPFNPYIPIRSTTIGKSRVAIDPIAMHISWRSNSDIASVTSAKAKRCRIDLFKRHRFAIAKLQVPTAALAISRPRANFSQSISRCWFHTTYSNAAFQLNETMSLHFYDWFPKPAAAAGSMKRRRFTLAPSTADQLSSTGATAEFRPPADFRPPGAFR
ncbi:hypothetical protein F511_22863 [Dorcoceras hygrometricum]|uniref:Uncharacterized protein n=1 Tax=Dorcoceras hygrometricum TaxID=472368 RepID=A0A2Z7APL0_9LAMI|nr:hypothetical protein F511_22863 [Dorcoceras hygrometricum]